MSKITNLKEKVEGKVNGAKEWVGNHKVELVTYAVFGGIVISSIAIGKKYDKKYHDMWLKAMEAMNNGSTNPEDYGPYKLMKIFEPGTEEFIGQLMCHEDACKGFLECK